MPPLEELTKLFEAYLEETGMKAAVKDNMRKLPNDKKWMIVQEEQIKLEKLKSKKVCIAQIFVGMHRACCTPSHKPLPT